MSTFFERNTRIFLFLLWTQIRCSLKGDSSWTNTSNMIIINSLFIILSCSIFRIISFYSKISITLPSHLQHNRCLPKVQEFPSINLIGNTNSRNGMLIAQCKTNIVSLCKKISKTLPEYLFIYLACNSNRRRMKRWWINDIIPSLLQQNPEKIISTITKGLQHWISTEGKSVCLFVGSMSAQGKNTPWQRCCAVVTILCTEKGNQ